MMKQSDWQNPEPVNTLNDYYCEAVCFCAAARHLSDDLTLNIASDPVQHPVF